MPRVMPTALCVTALALAACAKTPPYQLVTVPDPISNEPLRARITKVGDLTILTSDSDQPTLMQLSEPGHPLVTLWRGKSSHDVWVMGRDVSSIPIVTVKVKDADFTPQRVDYWGSQWYYSDSLGIGQADLRSNVTTKVTEIWLEGRWQVRTIAGEGTARRPTVSGRGVRLGAAGWEYDGT